MDSHPQVWSSLAGARPGGERCPLGPRRNPGTSDSAAAAAATDGTVPEGHSDRRAPHRQGGDFRRQTPFHVPLRGGQESPRHVAQALGDRRRGGGLRERHYAQRAVIGQVQQYRRRLSGEDESPNWFGWQLRNCTASSLRFHGHFGDLNIPIGYYRRVFPPAQRTRYNARVRDVSYVRRAVVR